MKINKLSQKEATKRRTPTAKATKCWANVMPEGTFAFYSQSTALCELETLGNPECCETVPAYLITQEQVEVCVEKMARAMRSAALGESTISKMLQKKNTVAPIYFSMARAALCALGIRGGKS